MNLYSNDMALFLLKLIHNLYWLNWYWNETGPTMTEKRLSGLSLPDCIKYSL
jgi:hypothetical protein